MKESFGRALHVTCHRSKRVRPSFLTPDSAFILLCCHGHFFILLQRLACETRSNASCIL